MLLLSQRRRRHPLRTGAGTVSINARNAQTGATSSVQADPCITHESGVTLVELIVVISIIAILASAAVPLTRWQVKRTKEHELRAALWELRGAIDKYKDAADRGAFQTKADSFNYPPDLDSLVNGVDVQTKKVKFLRRIPKDPMTGDTEWLLRSMQDENDAQGWGGQNVFDVHSKSQGTALDGTKYSEW